MLPPLQPPSPVTIRLTFAPVTCRPRDPHLEAPPQVTYHIPLDKAQEYFIPPGSLVNPSILIRPASPTTPFEFPFYTTEEMYCDFNVANGCPQPCLMNSVTHVVGLPRVCGLSLVGDVVVRVSCATTGPDSWDNPSLMDGGANICRGSSR